MSVMNPNCREPTVFLLTHIGNDARNAAEVLDKVNIRAEICSNAHELCQRADEKAGTLILGEEILDQQSTACLLEFLIRQPPWSDIPIVLLTPAGEIQQRTYKILDFLGSRANVTLLEKPMRAITLISVVKTALRARNHQYEVRGLLEQQEAVVRQRTAKLQETIGELEAFSYSISHDMRAPLRAMQGYAEALLADHRARLNAEAVHYLQRINRGAGKLELLVRDVLTYSKVAKGDLQLKRVNVEKLIAETVQSYDHLAASRIRVHVKPLPEVMGHEGLLTQIISNILVNAVKFAKVDVFPEMTISSETLGSQVVISFTDNGIGIAPRDHVEIFRIFGRIYPESEYEGTGIGLAIVKKACERMGGSVAVQSELGQGSRFSITLTKAV
jgi:signal transduction histidine kinase